MPALSACGDPCEQGNRPGVTGVASPSAGDGAVPTNAHLVLRVNAFEPLRCTVVRLALVDLRDGPVPLGPVDEVGESTGALFSAIPELTLRPDADYEILWEVDVAGVLRDSGVGSFRTGDGPDDEAPEVPVPTNWEAEVAPPSFYDGAGPLTAADWLALDVPGARFVLAAETAVDPSNGARVFALGEHGRIWGNRALTPGALQPLRFLALDLAGNASEWSAPVTLPVPGAGATARGRFDGSWLPLLLLPGLLPRWRRRRRPGRRLPAWWLMLPALLIVTPTPSQADEPSDPDEPADEAEPEPRFAHRRGAAARSELLSILRPELAAWTGFTVGATAASATGSLLANVRAPGALRIAFASGGQAHLGLMGTVTLLGIRARLRDGNLNHLERDLRGAAWALSFSCIPLTLASGVGSVLAGWLDPSIGFAVAQLPIGWIAMSVQLGVWAERLARARRGQPINLGRAPIFLPTPAGFALLF